MDHIVMFEEWCKKCQHTKVKETDEPCNECLSYPVQTDSTKPVLFAEKTK